MRREASDEVRVIDGAAPTPVLADPERLRRQSLRAAERPDKVTNETTSAPEAVATSEKDRP